MNILDMLLIKDTKIDRSLFSSLYYSVDNISFVGFNIELFSYLKRYDKYEILKERNNEIGEYHHELKYIISTNDNKYFIRLLTNEDNLIYDILIYSIADIDKINRIFFPDINDIPMELIKLNKPIVKVNDNVNLVYNHNDFTKYLGYEDWDYKNKCLNRLDFSAVDSNFIKLFKDRDFNTVMEFRKNGGDIISLSIKFKYINGYYIIDDVK